MSEGSQAALEQVVAAVLGSRRYRSLHPATVRRVATEQLGVSAGRIPEAVKRSKRALHQIFGAYLPRPGRWGRLLTDLREAPDDDSRRGVLRRAMAQHASTRERLDHLDDFAERLREQVGRPSSILDLACGLQPLAAPWLGLAPGTAYHAWDIDLAMVDFVGECLAVLGLRPHAAAVDLLDVAAWPEVEVALLLKTIPCLEQQDPARPEQVLRALAARRIVVSFPTRSLGGRAKGMHATYARRFEGLLSALGWDATTFEVGPELVYVVRREPA